MTIELHEVEVDGRPARYRVTGSGGPLVLVHGLAGSWRWWSPMLQELGGRRRVHVVNLPRLRHPVRAEELSNWLGRWLDAVGLDQLELAGHSLGGLVAAEVAATRPEQTRHLILVAPAGIPCGRGLSGRALPLLRTLYDVRRSLPMLTLDAVRTGPLDVVRGIAFVSDRDLRHELSAIRAPTLLVWGERDRLVPLRIAEEWRQAMVDVRLAYLHCGHVPMLEAPAELVACMLSFLDDQLADESGD